MTATAITYSQIAGAIVNGPSSCAAKTANCGVVTVTNNTTSTTASGTLTITPGIDNASMGNGTPVTTAVNLTVNSAAMLVWGANGNTNCSMTNPTMTPVAATLSCPLYNAGQTAATGIIYSSGQNTTVAGPASCAAGTATSPMYCGIATLTTATAAATYASNMVATPSNGGTATAATAQTTTSLIVQTTPTLLNNCTPFAPNPPTMTTAPTAASMTCNVSNSGQATAQSIKYSFQYTASSTGSGVTISGPTGPCAGTNNPNAPNSCGTVTVTTQTTSDYTLGTLTAAPNVGQSGSAGVQLQVNTPVALAFANCSSANSITPNAATMSCTLLNNGQAAASSISVSIGGGLSIISSPSSCVGASVPSGTSANCGQVIVSTPANSGVYSGTLTATPNTGSGASTQANLSVLSQPALALSGCNSSSPVTVPNAAWMTCSVVNNGQSAVTSIIYSTASGTAVSGPTSCAANAVCGSVTVTSGTVAGNYSGTLKATPNTGSGTTAPINLTVNTAPALSFMGCNSTTPVMLPQTGVMSCTLVNNGQTAASTITYTTAGSTTVSGPSNCAANTTCGTVTVTTSSAAATYAGALIATPNANPSLATSTAINLVVLTPPTLAFSGCINGNAPIGTGIGITSCTVSNTGQVQAASISYALNAISGGSYLTVSGPVGACDALSTCGTVVITYLSGGTTYSGTLIGTPSNGLGTSVNYKYITSRPPCRPDMGCHN